MAGLITAPPSAFDPDSAPVLNLPLVYNALQLPSPPLSPDAERDELVNYIIAMSQYASFTHSTIYAGNILNSDFVSSWTLIMTSFMSISSVIARLFYSNSSDRLIYQNMLTSFLIERENLTKLSREETLLNRMC